MKTIKHYTRIFLAMIAREWNTYKKHRSVGKAFKAAEKAKRLAMKRYQTDGRRYFVLQDCNGDLVVVNNSEIKRLQKVGLISKKATHYDFLREAVYFTPSARSAQNKS